MTQVNSKKYYSIVYLTIYHGNQADYNCILFFNFLKTVC